MTAYEEDCEFLRLRFEHRKRMERLDEFERYRQPIIREMVKLKCLFSSPWMIVSQGKVVESGEKWTDPKAAALYQKYEETLELLKLQILKAP